MAAAGPSLLQGSGSGPAGDTGAQERLCTHRPQDLPDAQSPIPRAGSSSHPTHLSTCAQRRHSPGADTLRGPQGGEQPTCHRYGWNPGLRAGPSSLLSALAAAPKTRRQGSSRRLLVQEEERGGEGRRGEGRKGARRGGGRGAVRPRGEQGARAGEGTGAGRGIRERAEGNGCAPRRGARAEDRGARREGGERAGASACAPRAEHAPCGAERRCGPTPAGPA